MNVVYYDVLYYDIREHGKKRKRTREGSLILSSDRQFLTLQNTKGKYIRRFHNKSGLSFNDGDEFELDGFTIFIRLLFSFLLYSFCHKETLV